VNAGHLHLCATDPPGDDQFMQPIRVMLVDDHRAFVETVAIQLREQPDLQVVAAESVAQRALDPAIVHSVDVAVLDLLLGGMDGIGGIDGIELGTELRRINRSIALVALTESETAERAAAAISAGFTGWVSKDATIEELVAVIRGVRAGETHVPSHLLAAALRRSMTRGAARHEAEKRLRSLSLREQQVLELLVCGLDRRGIGERLYISPNTVRTHQQHIMCKLDVHSVLGAVALVRASHADPTAEAVSR
jgi:DNA-binding NarL/FixJ family response regulator